MTLSVRKQIIGQSGRMYIIPLGPPHPRTYVRGIPFVPPCYSQIYSQAENVGQSGKTQVGGRGRL